MAAADDMDDLIVRFMDVTMCDDRDAAAGHLNSCHGSLDEAVGLYFAAAEEEEPVRPLIPDDTERLYGDDRCLGSARSTAPGAARYTPPPPSVPVPIHPPVPARTQSFYEDGGYLRAALRTAPGAPRHTPPTPPAPEPAPSPVNSDISSQAEEDQYTDYVVEEDEVASAASGYGELAEGEDTCSVRVRFPDGRVVQKEFGAKRLVAELFRYCHRHSVAGDEDSRRTGRPFRLLRFAGAASEEIRRGDATFEELGLHFWTLHLLFGLSPRTRSD